ncbi:rhodanese-like domain-containing protein [Spirosoma spitsbergense]|jgi:phage shock protein E|uniref:rhodanese-like domain-containing protein n=1 Tax=Spirosoma spitsbergense TaxID=431554 RepID=UPI0003769A37|nr:rhodanese-like domain-containing protein [Spirosoma spitsbergense]
MMNILKSLFGGGDTGKFDELRAQGAVIIDVRSPGEFASGHAKGAVNMPLDTLDSKVAALKKYKKPIILCCASGMRSGQATALLTSKGVADLHDAGSWKKLG